MIGEVLKKQRELKKADEKLKNEIFSIIQQVAKSQKLDRIAPHIFVIKLSEMCNKVWSAEYYDWEHSARLLIEKIKDKSGLECFDYITKTLLNTKTKMGCYEIIYYTSCCGWRFENKHPINEEFIDKLVAELTTLA